MKNCITLLDMMNSHSVPLLVKLLMIFKSQCIVSDVDSDCDIIHTHSITVQQIKCAISKMQSGKSYSIEQLSSDNFKNGTHMLNVYISLLFTCMLTHGIPPSGLLLSTIILIPKNKRCNMR